MQTSFFTKRPRGFIRLEIDRVISQFRGGIHRSAMVGLGFEFKGIRPYDPSDSPTVIDWIASARLSQNPALEPVSRMYYPEREIFVITLLNIDESMNSPLKKWEYAQSLIWLLALSAFRYNDRFRIITFKSQELRDSSWIRDVDTLEQFFVQQQHPLRIADQKQALAGAFAHLVNLNLRDTVIFAISDFCDEWKNETNILKHLNVYDNNIRIVLLALNQWLGFTPIDYSAAFCDLQSGETKQLDLREGSDFEKMVKRAEEKLLQIAKSVKSLSIPLIQISLLDDPIKTVRRKFLKLGFE